MAGKQGRRSDLHYSSGDPKARKREGLGKEVGGRPQQGPGLWLGDGERRREVFHLTAQGDSNRDGGNRSASVLQGAEQTD